MIRHLSAVGGTECTKVLNLMMLELMTDDVAVKYSYKGQRDKLKFEDLHFAPIFKVSSADLRADISKIRDVLRKHARVRLPYWEGDDMKLARVVSDGLMLKEKGNSFIEIGDFNVIQYQKRAEVWRLI
ncbi:unnamed protein product [Allacma fusca]|uniref:Uncharacterized protein n=1 Tax=Allacma fusca TaxID=39272 RepID=A0A8J2PPR1_9HEXA|nr:unnamed protein product [Allacma fusca]